MQTYDTHDNGDRAFRVKITDNRDGTKHVVVRQIITRRSRPLFQIDSVKVFIGKSPLIPMTRFSGGYGPRFDGNSILVELSDKNTYLHIGRSLLTFRTKSPIVRYESPVGNNDVPYPYAVDRDGNYYLLIENVILLARPNMEDEDPYDYYYAQNLMSPDLGTIPPRQPIDGPYHGIEYMTVGQEKYTVRYDPDPGAEFDRLTEQDHGPVFMYYDDDTTRQMTRRSYVKLIEDFGREHGFERLDIISEIKRE